MKNNFTNLATPENQVLDNEIAMDYTSIFTNFNYFVSRDDLQEWVHVVAKKHNMIVVVKRSESGEGKKKPQVLLACERGGEYRENKKRGRKKSTDFKDPYEEGGGDDMKRKKDTGSKKCNCPFLLEGKQLSTTEWTLDVKCGIHNHPVAIYLEGHSYVGRLTQEEEKLVINMSKFNTPAKDILKMLKVRNPANCSTIRTIYNVRAKNNLNERDGRNHLQHLMKLLIDNKYFHHHRTCLQSNTLRELFFAHPTSIQLFRAFPSILIMDCTYKTNRYRLPYLEMVGITSTGMTFSVASAFLQAEKEENYTWALDVLRDVLNNVDLPRVILTDRELSLMHAITRIFPQATQFLCTWHIDRNVLAKCKEKFKTNEKWKKFFYYAWKRVMEASSEEEFATVIRSFHDEYANIPDECEAYQYCMNQWVNPYKERFVAAWTDKVMHYENRTTNRVESHHSALKKSLGNSMGNFENCWNRIDTLYQASHNAVKASFEKSVNVAMHKLKGVLYKDLRGLVSIYALEKIHEEVRGINESESVSHTCDHFMRNVCGLPCTHELREYLRLGKSIPLDAVDKFWRKLDMEPALKNVNNIKDEVVEDIDSRFEDRVQELKRRYDKGGTSEKRVMLRQLIELYNPSVTSMVEPEQKINTRGRPKAKKSKIKDVASTKRDPSLFEYTESLPFRGSSLLDDDSVSVDLKDTNAQQTKKHPVIRKGAHFVLHNGFKELLPKQIQPYVLECKNVASDGHCGFRAVAALMGFGEDSWADIRRGMMNELSHNIKLYMRAFKEEAMVEEITNALNCFTNSAPFKNWFQLPYMGFLVASMYNVVVVTLGRQISLTFLPLRTAPPNNPKSICLGLVNENHFIQVFLTRDCPLPSVANSWYQAKSPAADGWLKIYENGQVT